MRKFMFMLMALLLIFSACSSHSEPIDNQPEINEPGSNGPSEPAVSEPENELGDGSRILEGCVFKSAEEKYGVQKDGKIILPATYDEFKKIGELGGKTFYALGFKNGTKPWLDYNEDGSLIGKTETERTLYEIFDSDGNMLLSFPADDFYKSTPKQLYVTLEGNYYIYDFSDNGEIEEEFIHEKGKTGRTVFGFDEIQYTYEASGFGTYIGLADTDGNVVLPEIYSYIVPVLDDRIIASTYSGMVGYSAYRLFDNECNLICEKYNYIDFLPIDREDTSKGFVGVATCYYPESQAYCICRDENGEIMPGGLWFVDKNGNALSERFDIKMISIDFSVTDNIAFVDDAEGKTTEIPIGDYIIEKDW